MTAGWNNEARDCFEYRLQVIHVIVTQSDEDDFATVQLMRTWWVPGAILTSGRCAAGVALRNIWQRYIWLRRAVTLSYSYRSWHWGRERRILTPRHYCIQRVAGDLELPRWTSVLAAFRWRRYVLNSGHVLTTGRQLRQLTGYGRCPGYLINIWVLSSDGLYSSRCLC